jgi:hypothetical protein
MGERVKRGRAAEGARGSGPQARTGRGDLVVRVPAHPTALSPVNGESLKIAQALLGHFDLETTPNTYIHCVSDSPRKALEPVAGVLSSDDFNSAALPRGRLI